MSLILTILNKPNPGQEISAAFHTEGTIGRSSENTWVLVDPERLASGKHAQISSSNGDYFLTDLSTNGVFINDATEALGKGNQIKLSHGDSIRIGPYDISVTIQADASLPLGNPDSSPFEHAGNPNGSSTLPDDPVSTDDLGHLNETSSFHVGGEKLLDPLAVLNGSAHSTTPKKTSDPGSIDDLGLGELNPSSPFDTPTPGDDQHILSSTGGDNASPLQQQFEPPPVSPPAPQSPPENGASPIIPNNWQYGAPSQTPPPAEVETPDKASARPAPSARSTTPASVLTSSNTRAMENLLKGMGLEHLSLTPEEEAALALQAGQLVRASVEGLVAVLRARASIKSEFRMSLTTIQARENNPIKFSPTGMDALNHMFSTGSSSYMPAIQAVDEGFNDLEAHMIAVMAGMQTALHTVLKRFDPIILEQDFEQREKGKSFSLEDFSLGGKKAKYWEAFNTHYKAIIASVEDDFHTLFGDEFSRAYEQQVAKLKAAKNSTK
ncbi:MAG: type VI secretion system-associated FHA domain protein TagH [Gammaproteobacteria bacterium]|nr:type VI secretion system-associated FHA domain protein TagH [Gammaproteobacteria bacterium]